MTRELIIPYCVTITPSSTPSSWISFVIMKPSFKRVLITLIAARVGTYLSRWIIVAASSSGDGIASVESWTRPKHSINCENSMTANQKRDPFVQAAPMIVVAACLDGAVVVAAHTLDNEEPLLYYIDDLEEDELKKGLPGTKELNVTKESHTSTTQHCESREQLPFLDLPYAYRGPFRIQQLDSYGTVLMVCGWRADGQELVDRARALATTDLNRFGPHRNNEIYAHYLAVELSLYLAQSVVSDRYRALRCAALLVVPSSFGDRVASLWLVDATGAYPVRAHCIGGGQLYSAATLDAKEEPDRRLADLVNERLAQSDWSTLSLNETMIQLLGILSGKVNSNSERSVAFLNPNTRLELGIVKSSSQRFKRKLLSSYWSSTSNQAEYS